MLDPSQAVIGRGGFRAARVFAQVFLVQGIGVVQAVGVIMRFGALKIIGGRHRLEFLALDTGGEKS